LKIFCQTHCIRKKFSCNANHSCIGYLKNAPVAARAASTSFQRDLPGCQRARPTHCASVRFTPAAQSGLNRPLPLRFSGICPDAFAQGKPTAHQFAFAPDAQSGLNPHCAEKVRNVPCGPLSLRFSGICPDASVQGQRTAHQFASLLMRNPGLTFISLELN